MSCRKARVEDIEQIMRIAQDAKQYMKENKVDQWTENYPVAENFLSDIQQEVCYVWEENRVVYGMMALTFDGEEVYGGIQEGNWNTEEPYGTIHRFAVSKEARGKGIAQKLEQAAEEMCKQNEIFSLRVDTHRHNQTMRKFLEKRGYQFCGLVYYEEKEGESERLAYDKIIK